MSLSKALVQRLRVSIAPHTSVWRARSVHSFSPLLRRGRWNSTVAPPSASWLRQGAVVALKVIFLWIPALAAWTAVVSGVTLDFRTAEEVRQEEQEAQRLERFFDVEHLPEVEYVKEWAAKEQALAGIVDKLIRSRTVQESMERSADGLDRGPALSQDAEAEPVMEFSYVHPPPEANRLNTLDVEIASEGYRPWNPRLILSHTSGGLALVTMKFQHLPATNGRSETWACTKLRVERIAGHGEREEEPLCDLQGPVPHGVRYMRI